MIIELMCWENRKMKSYEVLSMFPKDKNGFYILDENAFSDYMESVATCHVGEDIVFFKRMQGREFLEKRIVTKRKNISLSNIKEERLIAELVNPYIYKKFGIDSVTYSPATMGDWSGVVSLDFRSNYPYAEEMIEYLATKNPDIICPSALAFLKSRKVFAKASENFGKQLDMICLADFGLGQRDRHLGNLALYGKDDEQIEGLILYDNSINYIADKPYSYLKEVYENGDTYSELGIDSMVVTKNEYLRDVRQSHSITTSSIKDYLDKANNLLIDGCAELKYIESRVNYEYNLPATCYYFKNLEYYLSETTRDLEKAYNSRIEMGL